MKIFLLVALWAISLETQAQVFNRIYALNTKEKGSAISSTSDGGLLISGFTNYTPTSYYGVVYIMKLNGQGVIQWTKNIVNSNHDYPTAIKQLSNGNIMLSANMYDSTCACGKAEMILLDSTANIIWSRAYGEDGSYILSFVPLNNGNFIVCGHAYYNGIGSTGWIFSIDGNGVLLWSKRYDMHGFRRIVQTSDGGFIALGDVLLSLVKTDSLGNLEWRKTYNLFNGNGDATDLVAFGNGAMITGGIYVGCTGLAPNVFLLQIDSLGQRVWFKNYGSFANTSLGHSIKLTLSNEIVICGTTGYNSQSIGDNFILRTDTNGQLRWASTYPDSMDHEYSQLCIMADSGFSMVNTARIGSYINTVASVLRTDKDGINCKAIDWSLTEVTQIFDAVPDSVNIVNYNLTSNTSHTTALTNFSESDLCITNQVPELLLNDLTIFPNPVSSFATIKYSNSLNSPARIRIFDIQGKVISSFENNSGEFNLKCEALHSGCYVVEVSTKDKLFRKTLMVGSISE